MPATATHEIIISPAYDRRGERLAGRFNARIGSVVLVRAAATPFYDSARELLDRGLAKAGDATTRQKSKPEDGNSLAFPFTRARWREARDAERNCVGVFAYSLL
jgi:hypothetical protein